MSGIKQAKSSAALTVAVVALIAALGGGAVAGVTVSKLNQKEKKQVKRISKKQAKKLDKLISLKPGPQGEKGPKGDVGPIGNPGPAGSTSCPAGTTRLGDTAVCYETAESGPSGPLSAITGCSGRDRWLPPISVARTIAEATASSTDLWTDSIFWDGGAYGVTISNQAISYRSSNSAYRCIAYASDS